jgi:hypothetical protein
MGQAEIWTVSRTSRTQFVSKTDMRKKHIVKNTGKYRTDTKIQDHCEHHSGILWASQWHKNHHTSTIMKCFAVMGTLFPLWNSTASNLTRKLCVLSTSKSFADFWMPFATNCLHECCLCSSVYSSAAPRIVNEQSMSKLYRRTRSKKIHRQVDHWLVKKVT